MPDEVKLWAISEFGFTHRTQKDIAEEIGGNASQVCEWVNRFLIERFPQLTERTFLRGIHLTVHAAERRSLVRQSLRVRAQRPPVIDHKPWLEPAPVKAWMKLEPASQYRRRPLDMGGPRDVWMTFFPSFDARLDNMVPLSAADFHSPVEPTFSG